MSKRVSDCIFLFLWARLYNAYVGLFCDIPMIEDD